MRSALFAIFLVASAGRAAEGEPVVITVRASAVAPDGPVLVGHVATLSGGDLALRQRVAALDVADAPQKGESVKLLRDLVGYRVQIAGVERTRFRMEGPPVTLLSRGHAPAAAAPDNPVLVKPRDAVVMTARVGGLRVVTRGEALQEGRFGDRIRVRNLDSKREVVGRVAERGAVEVDY